MASPVLWYGGLNFHGIPMPIIMVMGAGWSGIGRGMYPTVD